ncbi:MAG TPA: FHA domain-containing protein [Thermoanaerobaculia bacterium]|nr:FHA domain-containing protein [Thermoanaerobaculia bacterium]
MIIECERCYARYRYDEGRFEGKSSKKVRCTKCLAVFEIYNTPALEAQPPVPSDADLGAPDWKPGEDTGRGKETPRKKTVSTAERRRSAAELKLPVDSKLSLAVISGPDSGKIFQITKPRVVIGCQGADINVDDPEISRAHAAVEVAGEHVTLVDLGSTNGTYIDEEQVSEAPLENQTEFTVGGTTLMLIVTSPR